MSRIRKIINSRLGFAILINIVVLLLAVFLFRPFFEESDDVSMALIVEGAQGQPSPYQVFTNIILGNVVCAFQSVIPAVRWHSVFQYVFLLLANTTFSYILTGRKNGKLMAALYLMGSFYETYVALQFTKTAAVITAIGFLILFYVVSDRNQDNKEKRLLTISAYLCLCYAMFLRIEAFLLGTLIIGIFGVVTVVKDWINRELRTKVKSYLLAFVPIFLVLGLSSVINTRAYSGQ